jgi:hypothetical protein
MSDRTNHRRVLHFAVTGVLLGGAVGCTGNERPGDDAKTNSGPTKVEPQTKQPEPEVKFAPNPGPNELEGKQPEVAPTTAVPPPEPIEEDHVNEGPVEEPLEPPETKLSPPGINEGPQREPEPKPEPKRVNTQRVREPSPEPKPPVKIKVNSGPADRP